MKFIGKMALFAFMAMIFCAASADAKGRKYGLFIGINEYENSPLFGCVNDAIKMQNTMTTKFGFMKSDTTLLLDKAATRQGIIDQIKKYEQMAGEGDLFVVHYSGHGSLFPDKYSEEKDETKMFYYEDPNTGEVYYPRDYYDAAIDPVDSHERTSGKPWRNLILDDELYQMFAAFTRKGVQVVYVSDSCFSGSIAKNKSKEDLKRYLPLHRAFGAEKFEDLKFETPANQREVKTPPQFNNLYLVLTGANEQETASDASDDPNVQMGLFTSNLVKALNAPGATSMTYSRLMASVGSKVAILSGRAQNPLLDTRFGNANSPIFSVPQFAATAPAATKPVSTKPVSAKPAGAAKPTAKPVKKKS